ncbi:hypothetical protein LV157_006686 [Aspergillus fumigatus]|nr:hypothetical protein LV157_006686 [Aspergillus fumigatus]
MASFFREVSRINGQLYVGATPISNVAVRHDPMHPFDQYDNERDGDNAVQWLFDSDAEDEAVDYDKQNNTGKENGCVGSCSRRKDYVGLQASYWPVIRKLRQLVHEGAVGRILSSTLPVSCGNEVAAEKSVISALGEFKPFTSSCAISRPRLDIVNYANGGKWSRTQCATQLQITFSFMAQQSQMRSAPSACTQGMPGLPRLDWRIQRERGWLRVASLGYLNVGTPETKLELSHTDSGRVEELKVDKDEWILCQSLVKILRDYTRHIAEGSRILHSAGL